MIKIEITIQSKDFKKAGETKELDNQIFIVYGKFKHSNEIEIIKAFSNFSKVEQFCKDCFLSRENPYREVIWEATILDNGE